MDTMLKTIQNNSLAKLTARAPANVMNAITQASAKTGVNFAYMVQQASAESSFDADAKAKSSSASGLYQFIESTWLTMVNKYGAKYGMEAQAAQISDKGKVADKAARKEILALRNDPEKAAAMAAEFAHDNQEFLQANWGGKTGPTELYFAHFMGAGGASAFLKARDEDPTQQAALIFPAAAKANRNVFYDTATGRPKTMDEVYAFFDKKFSVKSADTPDVPAQSSILVAEAAKANDQSQEKIISSVFTNAPQNTNNKSTYVAERRFNSLVPTQHLISNPFDIMFLSQLDLPTVDRPGSKNRI